MVQRISTLSSIDTDGLEYKTGDLSLFPEMLNDRKSLYMVENNAEAVLKQSLSYNGKHIILEDASKFPAAGIVTLKGKVDGVFELVYYDKRNDTTLMNLVRGFAGSRQNTWTSQETTVINTVSAEIHNTLKDAVIKIERNLGTKEFPEEGSLNQLLKSLESKHLAPKPLFRAFPKKGAPPFKVKFQNFSNSLGIRFSWDFGDGTTSTEKHPTHVYQTEGFFTVKLHMIQTTGAQGITIKTDYITVSNEEIVPFFYSKLISEDNEAPATYQFVDQTDGNITGRYWVFGDGNSSEILDANQHAIEHTYTSAGTYNPSVLIMFADQTSKRVYLTKAIEVE